MKRILPIVMLALMSVSAGLDGVRALSSEEQQIRDLKARIEELQRQQDAILGDLATTQEQRQTLQKEINSLLSQIRYVENQIAATETKIELNRTEQEQISDAITQTRAEMSRKRETIGRLVLFLEQRDQEDLVASLLKFADLSSFLRQLDDIAEVQKRMLSLVNDLKDAKAALEADQLALAQKETELVDLNDLAALKRSQLVDVKAGRDNVLRTTKGQEAAYQEQLKAVEDAKARLFAELMALEPQIVAGGLYILHVTAPSVPPIGTKLFQWPKDCSYLTQGYGMTAYAKRGAYGGAGHNGIDIACGYGSPNRAIGDGQVIANGTNAGWGNWVAIRHTNSMVSLYAHFSSFSAKASVGVQVRAGDIIGYEGTTGHVTGSHLHLSVYRDFFTYLKGSELYFNFFDGSLDPRNYM